MFFKIDQHIFQQHPDCVVGVIVATNIKNTTSNIHLIDILKKRENEIRIKLSTEKLTLHPHIAVWHEAYKKFGANPKKYLPSIENLLKRIIFGRSIAGINTLVDLYNLVSLRYLIPAGGEDLDTIKGDIQLAIASENEIPVLLLGDKDLHSPKKGEIFYKDDTGAICRRWNWKEADRTKLTQSTQNALFVLEGLTPVDSAVITSASNELAQYIYEYCGGTISYAVLNKENPSLQIANNGTYITHNIPASEAISYRDPLDLKIDAAQDIASITSTESSNRRSKIELLRTLGIEPWPQAKDINAQCKDVIDEFDTKAESRIYQVAGRIMTSRIHGKTAFAHIQDSSGLLQLYIREDDCGEEIFNRWQHFINIGDIVWIKGESFKTKTGEITLRLSTYTLLSKCLHPLPNKFHGIADVELTYRQRYLDLISNVESRERFYKRSMIIRTMRSFFDTRGFIEVETPMLHPIPGGAAARPFTTHHNALDIDLYLRIAPELYLKRLVIGGFERVYEINRNFRNEGISTRHNPEFTMVEWYMAHHDYIFMMQFIETMLRTIVTQVCGVLCVNFGEKIIDFEKPFVRMTMQEAVAYYSGYTKENLDQKTVDSLIKKHAISLFSATASYGEKLYALFEHIVEPQLQNPTFITEFPIAVSPLSKKNPHNVELADRFELFVAGMELANGFNELNDPDDQAERFKNQVDARAAGDQEAHHYDADYVRALEYGLPPTVGAGIGIDRLTMLLTNTTSIKDVILFPTLRSET